MGEAPKHGSIIFDWLRKQLGGNSGTSIFGPDRDINEVLRIVILLSALALTCASQTPAAVSLLKDIHQQAQQQISNSYIADASSSSYSGAEWIEAFILVALAQVERYRQGVSDLFSLCRRPPIASDLYRIGFAWVLNAVATSASAIDPSKAMSVRNELKALVLPTHKQCEGSCHLYSSGELVLSLLDVDLLSSGLASASLSQEVENLCHAHPHSMYASALLPHLTRYRKSEVFADQVTPQEGSWSELAQVLGSRSTMTYNRNASSPLLIYAQKHRNLNSSLCMSVLLGCDLGVIQHVHSSASDVKNQMNFTVEPLFATINEVRAQVLFC